jgi:Na+/melibiose symporter-like transporter
VTFRRTHWIGPCVGLGIASFGLQAITTVLMTYCVDSYGSQPLLVGQFVNITRQTIAFTVPFWNPILNEKLGYGLGFGVEAIIAVTFYIMVSFSTHRALLGA